MQETPALTAEPADTAQQNPQVPAADLKPWELYTRGKRATFLSVLFLVGASNYVDKNVIGVLLEQIKQEFQVSDTMLGLLSGIAFAFFYATLGIPVARWADRGDRKLVITLSLSVWSAMTALCGMAGTFWQLVLARFGVGAGEAGAVPPAQSLIADYYAPQQRARALGIFMASSSAGYVLGLVLGGFIAHEYGWRAAFMFFGLAGFALAPLAHFMLKEPRLLPQFAVQAASHESVMDAMRVLFAKSSYRNLLVGLVIYFLMAYGAFVFIISLMIRVHGLNVAQAGALFGAIQATGAVVGSVLGGTLADRLAKRHISWLGRVGGLGMLVCIPIYELALGTGNLPVMLVCLLLAAIVINAAVPSAFSAVHVVCGSKRRALSVAVVFLLGNLLGLGLGPVIAGLLSDMLSVAYGPGDGLRYALMTVIIVLLPAGWLTLRAGRDLERDAED